MRISLKRETAMGAYYGDNLLLDGFSKKVAVVIISFACFNVNFLLRSITCFACLKVGMYGVLMCLNMTRGLGVYITEIE